MNFVREPQACDRVIRTCTTSARYNSNRPTIQHPTSGVTLTETLSCSDKYLKSYCGILASVATRFKGNSSMDSIGTW